MQEAAKFKVDSAELEWINLSFNCLESDREERNTNGIGEEAACAILHYCGTRKLRFAGLAMCGIQLGSARTTQLNTGDILDFIDKSTVLVQLDLRHNPIKPEGYKCSEKRC